MLEHSEASSASLLLLDGAVAVDLNDPAILAMRTWHEPVELHHFKTCIAGEYAFPMLARGALLGVLVCGEKKSGEAFAPDEVDALKTLAHGTGMALEGFARNENDGVASLQNTLTALRMDVMARLDALSSEVRAQRPQA